MRKILSNKGSVVAVVDDVDYDHVSKYSWFSDKDGYAVRTSVKNDGLKSKSRIYMHRVINNTPAGMETDHINGNKGDNRRSNLRTATKSINQLNRSKTRKNRSGFKGVCWHKASSRWIVGLNFNKKRYYLGIFKNPVQASAAYKSKITELLRTK